MPYEVATSFIYLPSSTQHRPYIDYTYLHIPPYLPSPLSIPPLRSIDRSIDRSNLPKPPHYLNACSYTQTIYVSTYISPQINLSIDLPIYLLSTLSQHAQLQAQTPYLSPQIYLSFDYLPFLNARSSSQTPLLSCADECFDLCFLLQYVATLHRRHVVSTSARSSHFG